MWYIESECLKHRTCDKDNVMSFNGIKQENNVTSSDKSLVIIKRKGTTLLKKNDKTRNVLFVDGLRYNLLSDS